jgi:hypothetical protein
MRDQADLDLFVIDFFALRGWRRWWRSFLGVLGTH